MNRTDIALEFQEGKIKWCIQPTDMYLIIYQNCNDTLCMVFLFGNYGSNLLTSKCVIHFID